jgi:hypothetical protein
LIAPTTARRWHAGFALVAGLAVAATVTVLVAVPGAGAKGGIGPAQRQQ